MKSMQCEIITPEKIMLREEAEFIIAPGGELGILPGHTRLMADRVSGDVHVVNGKERKSFVVSVAISPYRTGNGKNFRAGRTKGITPARSPAEDSHAGRGFSKRLLPPETIKT